MIHKTESLRNHPSSLISVQLPSKYPNSHRSFPFFVFHFVAVVGVDVDLIFGLDLVLLFGVHLVGVSDVHLVGVSRLRGGRERRRRERRRRRRRGKGSNALTHPIPKFCLHLCVLIQFIHRFHHLLFCPSVFFSCPLLLLLLFLSLDSKKTNLKEKSKSLRDVNIKIRAFQRLGPRVRLRGGPKRRVLINF